jgi:hypothetical protein
MMLCDKCCEMRLCPVALSLPVLESILRSWLFQFLYFRCLMSIHPSFCFLSLRLKFSTPCETPIVYSKFVFKPCNDEVQCPSRLGYPFFTADSCFCECHFQAMRWCVLQAVASELRSILIFNCQVAMRTIVFARYEGQLDMRILRPSAQHTLISQLEQSLSPRSYPSLS